MAALHFLVFLTLTASLARAGSIRYDQTQTGDTNIHLQIKNVEVLALLDDFSPGEYDYDYSDFTEKPPKPGSFPNVTFTTAASLPVEEANATAPASAASSTAAPVDSSSSAGPSEPLLAATEPPASSTTKKTRRCGAGFYRDTMGRCRRIRRPHLQQMLLNMKAQTSQPAIAQGL